MDNKPIPQDEWMKRSNLRFFKRLDASMMVPQVVGLSHEVIVRMLRTQFEVVSRDVHYITIAARQILSDRVSAKIFQEDEILKAEKEVFKAFEAANNYFDTRITQAEQLLRESGMSDLSMRSGAVRLYEAYCSTRTATKWLELLKKADQYLTLNYQLWVTGEIGPSNWTDGEALAAKLNNERESRVTITQLARKVNQQFTVIRQLVSRILEQRANEESERRRQQSERDKAKQREAKPVTASPEPSTQEEQAVAIQAVDAEPAVE